MDALEIKERPRLQRYDRANTGGCGPQDHCTAVALEDSTEEEGTAKMELMVSEMSASVLSV